MLLSLSITGIFLSAILLCFPGRRFASAIYLGVFFMLISLYGFHEYLVLYSKSVFLLSIIYNNTIFLYYLIGPMLYWYVRSVLTDKSRLKRSDLWHLLPMIIFLTASLPEMFSSWSHKVEIAEAVVQDSAYLHNYKATILSEIFSVAFIYMSRIILVFIYTLWSIGLFIRYLNKKGGSLVLSRQYFMTKWLAGLLGFTLILVVSQMLLMLRSFILQDSDVFYTLNALQILSAAGLTGMLILPFFFPGILYGLPQLPESLVTLKNKEGEMHTLNEEDKKHASNLESDYLISIGKKSDACMKEFHPYLQPDFSFAHLSVLIHIPVHHLAYYFREEKKQHFNDYMNEWRINHAKNLINEGKAVELTLEAIGLKCGFPNRDSFRTTFKKVEGVSPSAFVAKTKK